MPRKVRSKGDELEIPPNSLYPYNQSYLFRGPLPLGDMYAGNRVVSILFENRQVNTNLVALSIDRIAEMAKCSTRQTRKILFKLEDEQWIRRTGEERFLVNPYLVFGPFPKDRQLAAARGRWDKDGDTYTEKQRRARLPKKPALDTDTSHITSLDDEPAPKRRLSQNEKFAQFLHERTLRQEGDDPD